MGLKPLESTIYHLYHSATLMSMYTYIYIGQSLIFFFFLDCREDQVVRKVYWTNGMNDGLVLVIRYGEVFHMESICLSVFMCVCLSVCLSICGVCLSDYPTFLHHTSKPVGQIMLKLGQRVGS